MGRSTWTSRTGPGHADSRTTREVYTHVLPESERKAAELMDSALHDEAAWPC
ncbi:hypothetical protein AB0M36_35095 [Actinoplanes sp. NPDC051346]|uniref:hypothetical protein n=1 Tax=Actinoplanes sp. NPDC051346 TaxID=3155048 RepID=UPI00343BC1CD